MRLSIGTISKGFPGARTCLMAMILRNVKIQLIFPEKDGDMVALMR